jgi:hypothetical protein
VSFATAKRDFAQLQSNLQGVSRLIRAIPRFLRERITLQQAEEEIKKTFDHRERRFLELVRRQIFERPTSPYRKLLRVAGCEFSDLQMLVRRSGVEAALKQLAREGVYLTSDEFKGLKTRRSLTIN